MKINANLKEALRWLKQAEADLSSAEDSLNTKHYEWCCFQSQQAAEKALKSFLYSKRRRAILTHSVRELIIECSKYRNEFKTLIIEARFLDTFYIPTRYPNGLPGTAIPSEFYTMVEAKKCLNSAKKIVRMVKKSIKQ